MTHTTPNTGKHKFGPKPQKVLLQHDEGVPWAKKREKAQRPRKQSLDTLRKASNGKQVQRRDEKPLPHNSKALILVIFHNLKGCR